MEIEIMGKSFPLAYTIEAQSQLAKKAGGLDRVEALFDGANPAEAMENSVFIVSIMMKAAENRERVKHKMMGNTLVESEVGVPTYEEICAVAEPGQIKDWMEAAFKVIKEGNSVTVEVEPEKKSEDTKSG